MKSEPVLVRSGITAAGAILVLLVAFNVPITQEQQDAILAALGPVALFVLGLWSRVAVTPNRKVVEWEKGGQVIAGEGSELPTGQNIRPAGSLDEIEGE